MKIPPYPSRQPGAGAAGRHLADIERLLLECANRQAALREDGRRLKDSLEKLSRLARDAARASDRLAWSARRLRTWGDRLGPRDRQV